MHYLVIRDVRLQGEKPKGDTVLEVNFDTPIEWPVTFTKSVCTKHSDVYLKIMAHGAGVNTSCSPKGKCDSSQGGGGIQFCKEWIRLSTLHHFAPLKGLLKGIDLMACGAAYITPGFEGKEGDGNYLCYRFAQVTGTYVRASTATQQYFSHGEWVTSHDPLDFGAWEGTVITYGPSGAVVKVEHKPGS